MKKEELWIVYVARNPQFEGEESFRITPAGRRKLFDPTWDQAVAEQERTLSTFEQLFGRKP